MYCIILIGLPQGVTCDTHGRVLDSSFTRFDRSDSFFPNTIIWDSPKHMVQYVQWSSSILHIQHID